MGSEGVRVRWLGVRPEELSERDLRERESAATVVSPPEHAAAGETEEDEDDADCRIEPNKIGDNEGARQLEEITRDLCLFSQSGVGRKSSKRG